METIAAGSDEFYHPANEEEIRQLIHRANRDGLKIRVRGSAHSVNAAIYTDHFHPGRRVTRDINILLDKMIDVRFDDGKMQVTVQAGCHLGKDPIDPAKTSTIENSLFYQLNQRGWAFPNTGGIIHQTVAGFLSTGSSGGSVQQSVGDHIVAIRIIDGQGNIHDLSESNDCDTFFAADVSMGLLGVVTAVTFQCVASYDVIGQELTTPVDRCEIDLFGPGTAGRPSLERFLRDTEHARLMWWPQKGVRRVVVWQGHKMGPEDYNDETGPPDDFRPKPYKEFPTILGSDLPAQILGSAFYNLIRYWNTPRLVGKLTRALLSLVLAPVIKIFVCNHGKKGPQKFWDKWCRVLPMDNKADDRLLPTEFTEMWIPLSKAEAVMKRLRDHYEANRLSATGTYACEIYATKGSRFWMSPAYEQDVIKIDVFWFGNNQGNPAETYYPQFWELLKDFNFRLHWGKYLRDDSVEYLRTQFPKWDDFMKVREELDPNQIFVTDYWRKHLGIEPSYLPGEVRVEPRPSPR